MLKFCWILVFTTALLAFSAVSQSRDLSVSAARAPDQSWQSALLSSLQNTFQKAQQTTFEDPLTTLKPGSELRSPEEVMDEILRSEDLPSNVKSLPRWTLDLRALDSLSLHARSIRRYQNPNPGDFLRHAPWLYPADGCYAKAAHVSAEALRKAYVQPGKVFAYGNLVFRSPFAQNGKEAYWSYHVVPGYQIEGQVYVLDPMINSRRALLLSEWLGRISPDPASLQVKLCDAHAYSPYSKCQGGKGNGAYLGHMRGLLIREWNNLKRLGHSPEDLLGARSL